MKKTYAVLGGGGSFGLHTSKYLLDHADPAKVIAVGRNLPKDECFTLGIGDGDPRYSYHAYHVNYDLDREKPQVIINFAAQGEGATSLRHSWRYFETNCVALAKLAEQLQSRGYLERFIHIGTSELYGSVDHAAREDEPIKPTSPYAASKAAFDMHLISIHRFLKFPMNIIRPSNAYGPGQQLHRVVPKAVLCGLTGRKLPLHVGGRGARNALRAALRGDRRPPASGFALLDRQLRHQARCRLGTPGRLGARHARNGRMGPQIFAAAQDAADRFRDAGLMLARRRARVEFLRCISRLPGHAAARPCRRGAAATVG